ncbi:MAG TPA: hypothetical protein VFQ63_03320 [Patescibacteria group bacterium]|nr:hypothetical protein [Patescibacteria group bacterium]
MAGEKAQRHIGLIPPGDRRQSQFNPEYDAEKLRAHVEDWVFTAPIMAHFGKFGEMSSWTRDSSNTLFVPTNEYDQAHRKIVYVILFSPDNRLQIKRLPVGDISHPTKIGTASEEFGGKNSNLDMTSDKSIQPEQGILFTDEKGALHLRATTAASPVTILPMHTDIIERPQQNHQWGETATNPVFPTPKWYHLDRMRETVVVDAEQQGLNIQQTADGRYYALITEAKPGTPVESRKNLAILPLLPNTFYFVNKGRTPDKHLPTLGDNSITLPNNRDRNSYTSAGFILLQHDGQTDLFFVKFASVDTMSIHPSRNK